MTVVLSPAGEGEALLAAGVRMTIKLPSAASGDRFAITEYDLPAGFPGPPPHVHTTYEHAWYVLEGRVRVLMGERSEYLPTGSFVYVPAGTPHTFGNDSGEPARLLAIDSPGTLEGYYRDLAAAFPPGTPLDRGVVAGIQQRYDTRPA